MESRNVILAITLSTMVLIFWAVFLVTLVLNATMQPNADSESDARASLHAFSWFTDKAAPQGLLCFTIIHAWGVSGQSSVDKLRASRKAASMST